MSTTETGSDAADSPDDPGDREWVEFEYQPAGVSTVVAIGASMVATVTLASTWLAASVGAGLGTVLLAAGLVRGSRRLVGVGAGAMLFSIVVAGLADAPVIPVVIGAVAVLVAYDAAQYAVQIGKQMGAAPDTTSTELSHIVVTVAVTVACGTLGVGVFVLAPAQQPEIALFTLLVAAVLFLSGLALTKANETGTA